MKTVIGDLPSEFQAFASLPTGRLGSERRCVRQGQRSNLKGHDPLTGADAPFFLYLGIITTLIGIPLLVWRVRSFQTIFTRGVEVPGRITNISFYRDRGRVEYVYTHQGETYQGANAIIKTGWTKALQPGDEVVLIVDRENPKRALIRDLYV